MKEELLHILQHSLGVDQYGQGNQYRNHFATGPGGKDFDRCLELAAMGMMQDLGSREAWGKMHCFIVTPHGVDAVALESPRPPRLSRSKERYRRYMEISDCFESFKHFLGYEEAMRKRERMGE